MLVTLGADILGNVDKKHNILSGCGLPGHFTLHLGVKEGGYRYN